MPPAPSTNPDLDSWTLLGRALADYAAGQHHATALLMHEDGECWPLRAAIFFREYEELEEAEVAALELCCGRVLDVGAGAGCHVLELQGRGLEVCGLDVCPQAVAVMRRRGVRDARRGDVFDPTPGDCFDTLLLLMNGIGLVGDLAGLGRFFERAGQLLTPEGQILFDSCDLRRIDDPRVKRRMAARERQGRYRGETIQQLAYRGEVGLPIPWLYVDAATLRRCARRCGWVSQVVFEDQEGTYLARLTRRP